jgi:hypothetical protein
VIATPAHAGLPACASAPCASDRGPVVILSYWQSRHYSRLVDSVERARLPGTTPVYYGNYWGSGHPSEPKPVKPRPRPPMPSGRPAPIFPLAYSVFWRKRRLPARDRRTLRRKHVAARGGRIPGMNSLLHRSGRHAYAWGLELGRRFRDRIRNKRRNGTKVTTWQFDELVSELGGHGAARRKAIVRGVLDGLWRGRPDLGDRKLPGIVYATQKALASARRGEALWRSLDRATLWVAAEEYPDFIGSPGHAARHESRGQHALRRAGKPGRSLARKYVVGMTPGYRPDPGLGGNVRGRSRRSVNSWRERFVRARARRRVAGFAQYGFRFQNSSQTVMRAVLRSMAKGARLSR